MEILKKTLETFNIEEIPSKIKLFEGYREKILQWNEKVNLTAITDDLEFEKKHFVDSVLIAAMDEMKNAETIIDVGTGGGFPGIPLAIIFPQKEFVLMDSLKKRMKIVEEIAEELEIKNVKIIHSRAEELGKKEGFRESFDLCVSRAVANIATLSEYCLPFVKVGGNFIAYKGRDITEEIKEGQQAIKILGGEILDIKKVESVENYQMEHQLVAIRKMKNTPKKYPRRAGDPAKEPIK